MYVDSMKDRNSLLYQLLIIKYEKKSVFFLAEKNNEDNIGIRTLETNSIPGYQENGNQIWKAQKKMTSLYIYGVIYAC